MSRPRFLANDFKDAIIRGVRRRETAVEFVPLRNLGLESRSDVHILDFAAHNHWLVVSHDGNTMTAEAFNRMTAGETMSGLLPVHQRDPIGPVIESSLLIWEAETRSASRNEASEP